MTVTVDRDYPITYARGNVSVQQHIGISLISLSVTAFLPQIVTGLNPWSFALSIIVGVAVSVSVFVLTIRHRSGECKGCGGPSNPRSKHGMCSWCEGWLGVEKVVGHAESTLIRNWLVWNAVREDREQPSVGNSAK